MQQIAHWLNTLGLGQYAQRFADNDIDTSILRDLTDEDLQKIGVSLGHRKKILRAIRELADASPAAPPPATASQPAPHDTAERRQLTVMFIDLVGSTALSTRLDPEDLREIIGAYHRCCAKVITQSDGFVARYLGDGVLAYFGYPQAHEDDAEQAVRAGLTLVEAVAKLDADQASSLRVRVGIATGLVVVGDLIGGDPAHENEVVGETPNLAARLQALAEPDAVVIESGTRRLLGGLFDYRDLGAVPVKGFGDAVRVWRVLGTSSVDSRFEALRAATTPLVGREEEIAQLMRRWQQAKSGEGCVVLISGEPGIGKSRIAQTVLERLGGEPHTRLRYFCLPHHQDSAFHPSIAQLERAAGFRREDTDEHRLDKLEAVLALGTDDLSEVVPLLADLLSIPTGHRYPPLNLTPQKRKEKTLDALLAQVEGLAKRQPVLMVFEDIHWSDPTTRESLDLLIDRVPALRVLVIITFRPEFAPPWIGRPQLTLLNLNRLPPRQRAEMIIGVTGGKTLPREIADQIIDRTDGVPLFIEELTKAVVESGMLTDAGEGYAVTGPVPPLAIPASLHASLLARLDRLAPAREVAQIGAALGRQFSYELISAVAPMSPQQLDDALAQLVCAELIFQRETPRGAEYTFKHALVQDAAYSTLLRSRRQQLHGNIARAIERHLPDVVATEPETLAHHFTQAGLAQQAIGYWLKAGRLALARSANSEAVSHIEKGLAIVRELPEGGDRYRYELNLQCALGNALNATRGYAADVTLAAYRRAHELIGITGDYSSIDLVMEGLTTTHYNRAEYAECLKIRQEFLAIAERRGEPGSLCFAYRGVAAIHNVFGNFAAARAHGERAWSFHGRAKHAPAAGRYVRDVGVAALCHLAFAEWHLGHLDRSKSHLETTLALAMSSQHPNTVGYAHLWATVLSFMGREYGALQKYASLMITLGHQQSLPFYTAWGTCLQAPAIAATGDDETALQSALAGQALRDRLQAAGLTTMILYALAEVHHCGYRNEEALVTIGKALEIADRTEERWMDAELWRLKGEVVISAACGRDTANEVGRYFHRALDIARGQGSRMFELRAATSLSRYLAARRQPDCARGLLAPLYAWFTEGLDTPDLKAAKALLDQLI